MNGGNGGVAYAVLTAVNAASELSIFVPRAAHGHELSLSFVAGHRANLLSAMPSTAATGARGPRSLPP
jgi:hypothetical protein